MEKRGTMGVKCITQEHNTMTQARVRVQRANGIRPARLPKDVLKSQKHLLIEKYFKNARFSLLVKRTADTINSLEALANQDKIKYGVLKGGSVRTFFENSEDSLYRKMYSHMREYQTFVEGTAAGVERARTEQYAYITEYPYLDYYNQQKPCNTRLLKNLIQTKSYGIGLQRNSPYTNKITVAILKVRVSDKKKCFPCRREFKQPRRQHLENIFLFYFRISSSIQFVYRCQNNPQLNM